MAETSIDQASSQAAARGNTKAAPLSRLGRGLGSLIPASPLATPPASPPAVQRVGGSGPVSQAVQVLAEPKIDPQLPMGHQAVSEISIVAIAKNTRQPRERFENRALQALAESITQHGLLQPILVRRISVPRGTLVYELIAGERRLRAFELLGRQAIPAIIREADEQSAGVLALIENVQREDLNPIERAIALKRLIAEFNWTQQQVAGKVGLDRASVANLIRLTELDPFVSACVREGKLSQGHAKALLAIEDPLSRRAVAERALHDEWSVRQIEREVQRVKGATTVAPLAVPPPPVRHSAQVADLERRLGQHLGTKVAIAKGKKSGSGKLTISFFSLDQFDGLLNRLGFNPNSLHD